MIEVREEPLGIVLSVPRGPGREIILHLSHNEAAELFHFLAKLYVDRPVLETDEDA